MSLHMYKSLPKVGVDYTCFNIEMFLCEQLREKTISGNNNNNNNNLLIYIAQISTELFSIAHYIDVTI